MWLGGEKEVLGRCEVVEGGRWWWGNGKSIIVDQLRVSLNSLLVMVSILKRPPTFQKI